MAALQEKQSKGPDVDSAESNARTDFRRTICSKDAIDLVGHVTWGVRTESTRCCTSSGEGRGCAEFEGGELLLRLLARAKRGADRVWVGSDSADGVREH
eukprot:1142865-Rhodomonas_salina.1